MRWLFPIFTVLIALFLQAYEDQLPSGVRVSAVVLSAAMILLFVLTSAPSAINPLTVYGMLALTAGLGWIWLRALTELGPAGVLTLVLGLLALTTYLTVTRGDALRRRREASGLCGRCGYDLRASPDVCPECGAAVGEDLKRRRRTADELAAARAGRDGGQHVHGTSLATHIGGNSEETPWNAINWTRGRRRTGSRRMPSTAPRRTRRCRRASWTRRSG